MKNIIIPILSDVSGTNLFRNLSNCPRFVLFAKQMRVTGCFLFLCRLRIRDNTYTKIKLPSFININRLFREIVRYFTEKFRLVKRARSPSLYYAHVKMMTCNNRLAQRPTGLNELLSPKYNACDSANIIIRGSVDVPLFYYKKVMMHPLVCKTSSDTIDDDDALPHAMRKEYPPITSSLR